MPDERRPAMGARIVDLGDNTDSDGTRTADG
jgi:hypothetical protein